MALQRTLFGTDGIRGTANTYPMTGEVAMALGRAVTYYFQKNHHKRPVIVIGKDTRRSCYMLEQAFSAGVCSQGGRAVLTGPLPTPGVAFVTLSMRADAGVMISASHNSFEDNGIKIFDTNGNKLPDDVEFELEKMIMHPELIPHKSGDQLGSAKRLDEVIGRYIVHTKAAFPSDFSLDGMKIVVDAAHGAAYKIAPIIFDELGAEVVGIGLSPNGININKGVGALHPELCQKAVLEHQADLGICLDGDADRLVLVSNDGKVLEGDKVIGILAMFLRDKGELASNAEIVGTVMSNVGLESFLKKNNLQFSRTNVGDRYILEQMKKSGALFGGEPSGHLIFRNLATTGDGILAGLKMIECLKFYKKSLSELEQMIVLYPQELINIKVNKKIDLSTSERIQKELRNLEKALGEEGRVLLRFSGTEPLLRLMIEGLNLASVKSLVENLTLIIKEELN